MLPNRGKTKMKLPNQFKPKRSNNPKTFTPTSTRPKRSSRQLGYDSKWDSYRFRFLHHNPYCYACGLEGGKKLHVDHIIPHRGDPNLFWKLENMISLCHSCHSTVTQMFDCSDPPNTEGKLTWINNMRKNLNITRPSKIVPIK